MTELEEPNIATEISEQLEAVENAYICLAGVEDSGMPTDHFLLALIAVCEDLVEVIIDQGEDMKTIAPLLREIGQRNNLHLTLLDNALMHAYDAHLNRQKKTLIKPISAPNSRKIAEIKAVVDSGRNKTIKIPPVLDTLTDMFMATSRLDVELLIQMLNSIFQGTELESLTYQLVHQAQYDALQEITKTQVHILQIKDEDTGRTHYLLSALLDENN